MYQTYATSDPPNLNELKLQSPENIKETLDYLKMLGLNDQAALEKQLVVAANGKTYLLCEIAKLQAEELKHHSLQNFYFMTNTKEYLTLEDVHNALNKKPPEVPKLIFNKKVAELLPSIIDSNKLNLTLSDCPILFNEMSFPYISIYGYDFERTGITKWLNENKSCPITRGVLTIDGLIPNLALEELQWLQYCQRATSDPSTIKNLITDATTQINYLREKQQELKQKQQSAQQFLQNEPMLTNPKNLNEINALDYSIRLEQRQQEIRHDRIAASFSLLTRLSFWSGLVTACFMGALIANPVLGISLGVIIGTAFLAGIVGNRITNRAKTKRANEFEQRLSNLQELRLQISHTPPNYNREIEALQQRINAISSNVRNLEAIKQASQKKQIKPSKPSSFWGFFSCHRRDATVLKTPDSIPLVRHDRTG